MVGGMVGVVVDDTVGASLGRSTVVTVGKVVGRIVGGIVGGVVDDTVGASLGRSTEVTVGDLVGAVVLVIDIGIVELLSVGAILRDTLGAGDNPSAGLIDVSSLMFIDLNSFIRDFDVVFFSPKYHPNQKPPPRMHKPKITANAIPHFLFDTRQRKVDTLVFDDASLAH